MSLILDALRRAESGRARELGQRLAQPLPPHARRRRRRGITVALLVTFAAAAAVAVHLTSRPPAPPPVEHVSAEPDARATQPARGSSLADIALPAARTPDETDAAPPRPDAPLLQQLPDELRVGIPPFTVNAHFWSADAARRFIVIDMQRHRAGDRVREGLRVVDVTPDGAELEWRGTRFRVLAQ